MIQNRVYFFAHCWKQSTLNTIKSDEQKKLHVVHWFLCVLSTHYVWICLRERDLRILTVIFISAHRPELQPPAVRFFCAICWAQGCHRDRCHISQDTYFCCICQVAAFSVHYPIKNSLQHLKWPGEKNIARNLSISHKYTLKKNAPSIQSILQTSSMVQNTAGMQSCFAESIYPAFDVSTFVCKLIIFELAW